jgi:hypothetical protein
VLRRHRNLWFRLVTLAACTALALTTVGAATAATRQAAARQAATRQAAAPPARPATTTTLTSVGSNARPGIAPSADSAVAANGRYVAFASQDALKVSRAIPLTEPVTGATGNWRIYVRDATGRTTTLLSDPGLGVGTVPSISANGRLVSYDLNDGSANYVDVADRQATGKGTFDTRANLVVRQVTGTANDLRYERIPDCPTGIGDGPATPCGPRLSADGTTLAYPAQLSPESPALIPNQPTGPVTSGGRGMGATYPGNIADFSFFFPEESGPRDMEIDYTLQGDQPLTLGQPTTTGPFSVTSGDDSSFPECGGSMNPGSTCGINVTFDASKCPAGFEDPELKTGQLMTNAADPAGQTELTLVAYCDNEPSQSSPETEIRPLSPGRSQIRTAPSPEPGPVTRPRLARQAPRSRSVVAAPTPGCPAIPTGLRLVAAPAAQNDNNFNPVTDLGDAQIGRPYVAWTNVSPDIGGEPNTVLFQTSGCGIQLVNPAALKLSSPLPTGQPAACTPTLLIGESGEPDTCTAYLLVDPAAVGTDAAALSTEVDFTDGFQANLRTLLTATGVSNVVVARRDASGGGHFAASPSTVVSVDGSGQRLPGASQASVSATGRYVAFTAPVPTGTAGQQVGGDTEVWRHDSDARGNRTYHPGRTTLVSCLPGRTAPRPCARAQSADSPSISGDGSRVAFSAAARAGAVGQVYARNLAANAAVLVSLAATGGSGNGASSAPALSLDGSTVAYISQATNLTKNAVPAKAANLYVRTQVALGSGGSTELASPSGASLPAGNDIALPAVDAHGQLVTFQTAVQLAPQAPSGIDSIYTFERFPRLTFAPGTLGFGRITAGTPPRTRTVTVTDTGPGPAPVTRTGATPPFTIILDSCAGTVLYAGTTCQLTILLDPLHAGHEQGTVTVVTTDADEPLATSIVPATATVIRPVAARLAANPAVSSSGEVTQVTGTGFPAGQRITLSWQPGLGTVTVIAATSGALTAEMVIFPDDSTGPRTLLATAPSGQVLAQAAFLVEAPSVEPPFTAPPSLPATPAPPATSPTAAPGTSPTPAPAASPPATSAVP